MFLSDSVHTYFDMFQLFACGYLEFILSEYYLNRQSLAISLAHGHSEYYLSYPCLVST